MQEGGSRQAWFGTEIYCERIQANFRDGLKGPENKTEPTRRMIVVKPFSKAENHLRGEGGLCAPAEHQPGLLLVFLSWHRNFCAEFQGSSTPKMTESGTGEVTKPVQSGQVCETAQRSKLCPGSACTAGRLPALPEPPGSLLHQKRTGIKYRSLRDFET